MKFQVLNIDGKKTDTVEISNDMFVPKANQAMIKNIIDWQINNLKPRKAKPNKEMKSQDLPLKYMRKKVLVVRDIVAEKLRYLSVEELLTDQKEKFIEV